MNKRIHMIGNAHLDPVWLWQWQEGYAEIKATFRSALDRMNEFPDFIFTCAAGGFSQTAICLPGSRLLAIARFRWPRRKA